MKLILALAALISTTGYAQLFSSDNVATPTTRCKKSIVTSNAPFSVAHGFGKEPDKVEAYYKEYFTDKKVEMSQWCGFDATDVECKFPSGQDISPTKFVEVKYCVVDLVGSAFDNFAKTDEANTFTEPLTLDDGTGIGTLVFSENLGAGLEVHYEPILSGRSAIYDPNNSGDNQIAFGFGSLTNGVPANVVGKMTVNDFEIKAPNDGNCGDGNVCSGTSASNFVFSTTGPVSATSDHQTSFLRVGNTVTVGMGMSVTCDSLGSSNITIETSNFDAAFQPPATNWPNLNAFGSIGGERGNFAGSCQGNSTASTTIACLGECLSSGVFKIYIQMMYQKD